MLIFHLIIKLLGYPLLSASVFVGLVTFVILYYNDRRERMMVGAVFKAGYHNSEWGLVSGGVDPKYFDLDRFIFAPKGGELAVDIYCELIEEAIKQYGTVDFLAFVDKESGPVGAMQLKENISSRVGLPTLIVRPRKRLLKAAVKGSKYSPGQRVFLINDVVTSGRGLARVKKKLELLGLQVVAAIVILARKEEQTIKTRVGDLHIKYYSDKSSINKLSVLAGEK